MSSSPASTSASESDSRSPINNPAAHERADTTAFGHDDRARVRRAVYLLLIVTSVMTLASRITQVESSSGRTPFLSANDRSRWATIRSLVDHGTFSLDDVIYRDGGQMAQEAAARPELDPLRRRDSDWYSIDLVRHRGRDGIEHAYSSKPPLLSVLLAGEYWCVRQVTHASLAEKPMYVGRIMLVLSNLVPLVVMWWLLAALVERWGTSDWGRLLVMTMATWGTLLSPMAITLNNHLPAAVSVTVLLYAIVRSEESPRRAPWLVLAGLAAAFTAACELPALSVVALAGAILLWRAWRETLIYYAPAVALVGLAAVATNYVAHGTWRPPYAHRHDGALLGVLGDQSLAPTADGPVSAELRRACQAQRVELSENSFVRATHESRWRIWDATTQQRFALRATSSGLALHAWDNWYEYEGSYWTPDRLRGVDRGESSRSTYAFHALLGHHGVFSLTPFWLLSVVGGLLWLCSRQPVPRVVSAAVILVTLVCLAFYLARPLIDRNYGGVSCGFRWMFWFIPAWLLLALPAADLLGHRRWARGLAVVLLAASVFSAQWSGLMPWTHPWIFEYWSRLGWISYP